MKTAIAVMKNEEIIGYYLADDQDYVSQISEAKLYETQEAADADMSFLNAAWVLADGERFVTVSA